MKKQILGGESAFWIVSQTQLAEILGITVQRVNQLTADGTVKLVPKMKNGEVYLIGSMIDYFKRKYAAGDLTKEKTLHERAKRELTEMEVAKRRGELLERAAVTSLLAETLTNFRNKFSGFPAKLSLQLENKPRADVNKILTAECDELLTDLAKSFEGAVFNAEIEGGADEGDTAG